MKRVKYFILTLVIFMIGTIKVNVSSNRLYSLDIKVKINSDASADITEVWNMKVEKGTEVYKPMANLGPSEISKFKVSDESGTTYTNITWDINVSLEEKQDKSGIRYISDGLELCWGMGSYGKHTYTISYHVTNFVRNVEDSQMVYWKLVNDSMNPTPERVKITISSDIYFENTLKVWGYGYKGLAYVSNGKIRLLAEESLGSNNYVVLLAKFDSSTFNATVSEEGSFNDWYKKARKGVIFNIYLKKL